jgi:hypothetical protein
VGTYGAVAKEGASAEVRGNVLMDIEGVANKADCAAAWATGYAGALPQITQSAVYVQGSVSATSRKGGVYGALATAGGVVQIIGNAAVTGIGSFNVAEGDIANMVVAAFAEDTYSSAYVDGDAAADGLYNVYGCLAKSGANVAVSGKNSASGIIACGAAAYGENKYTWVNVSGDTEVTAAYQDIVDDDNTASRATGGYATGKGDVELWNLTVKSDQAAWGIVSDGAYSKVTAQAKVSYSGGDAEHSGGAMAMNSATARVNGYFTADSDEPVFFVNDQVISEPYISGAYNDYTDNAGTAHVYVIKLGKVSGTVTDADGVPLPGITVWVYDEHYSTVTDANGMYIVDPMPLYQENCWATAEISADVYRSVNPFTRSMVEGSTTTVDFTNTSSNFAQTTNKNAVPNDEDTLGLNGTTASSNNMGVVIAQLSYDGRIRLSSYSEGSATVTIQDDDDHKATVAVSVNAQGYITIGTITKYDASAPDDHTSHSGGGGGSAPTAPIATVAGSTATAAVPGIVAGGTQTVPVLGDTMTSLTDAVKKLEAAGESAAAVIAAGTGEGLETVKVTVPGTQFRAFAAGTSTALQFTSDLASLTFSAAAVDQIASAGTGDVTLTISAVDAASLSDAQRQAAGDRQVFSFTVTVGGTAVTELGGEVTVSIPYTPGAGEDANAIIVCCLDATGALQTMQGKYDAATKCVVFTTTHFSDYVIGYNKMSFTDVAADAWYEDAVTFLSARGVTSGTTETTFSPDGTLTRGQFITMLLRAYGVAEVTSPTENFADAGDTYYTGYLAAAKTMGITSGVGDNLFAPGAAITRQEMFTMLYNALKALDRLPSGASGKTLADFADSAAIAPWASDAMTALVKAGTVTGSAGLLSPTGTTTRAEMAQVLFNLLGK